MAESGSLLLGLTLCVGLRVSIFAYLRLDTCIVLPDLLARVARACSAGKSRGVRDVKKFSFGLPDLDALLAI